MLGVVSFFGPFVGCRLERGKVFVFFNLFLVNKCFFLFFRFVFVFACLAVFLVSCLCVFWSLRWISQ